METGAQRTSTDAIVSSPAGATPGPAPVILRFDELDSTNAEARRRAEAGEAGPLWITARRQSLGRGRRGRAWQTGAGDLAATLLASTARRPFEAAQIAFVAALAVADLTSAYVEPERVAVKWPNDVLIGGRKTAGVLVESGALAEGRLWLAVGVGVNLASPPLVAELPATSFAEHLSRPNGAPPSPDAALSQLVSAFSDWMVRWDTEGFRAVAEAWTARAYGLGRPCTARLDHETVEGTAEGLDVDGAFRLRQADGSVRRITAGDVFFAQDGGSGSA